MDEDTPKTKIKSKLRKSKATVANEGADEASTSIKVQKRLKKNQLDIENCGNEASTSCIQIKLKTTIKPKEQKKLKIKPTIDLCDLSLMPK